MTENKRFELCVDSNNRKSIWDNENNEGEPLLCLNRFNEMWGIDEVYDLLNALSDENEQLKKDLEILVHLVDWRDKLEKEWWRCEHFTSPLGVAFCSKNEDFCKKGECGDI